MSSPEELRNVMNEVAATTESLSASTVLEAGKRYRSRRRLLAGSGAAAAVLGVVAGIAVLAPGAQQGAASSGDATAQLQQSVQAMQDGNYTFTRTGAYMRSEVENGAVHLPDGYRIDHAQDLSVMRAGGAAYLHYTGSGKEQLAQIKAIALPKIPANQRAKYQHDFDALLGDDWLKADEKRLTEAAAVDAQSTLDYIAQLPTTAHPDVTGADTLINAVNTATRRGSVITGTLDGTKVDQSLGLLGPVDGPDAATMGYRAVLDDQGRLSELTVQPAAPASAEPSAEASAPASAEASAPAGQFESDPVLVITVKDYGQTATPAAPATSVPLTAAAYELLAHDND